MDGGDAPKTDQFPSGWFGEKEELVNMHPYHLDVTFGNEEIDGAEDESIMKEFRNYFMLIDQSYIKLDGKARHAFYRLYKKMGIAGTYSQRILGHSTSFYSTLIQVVEALGPVKKKIFNLQGKSSLLLVNDTSNALTLGSLLLAKKMKIDYSWTGIISGLFNEDVVRNYQHINDLADFVFEDRLHRCMLFEDKIIDEMSRVIECLWKDLGYSTIVADVTGDFVLEELENVTQYEGTKWLFLTRHLIRTKLNVKGNAILRLQVRPLLNKNFLRLLIDISKDFDSMKWIQPLGGRDIGVIFLVLQDYSGNAKGGSNDLFNAWPVPQSIPVDSEEMDFINAMNKVLKVVVPAYASFIDSTLQMMYLDEQVLHNCMLELECRRERVMDNLGAFVKRFLDEKTINEFVNSGKDKALIFNWFNHRSMPMDKGADLSQSSLKDQTGLLLNVHGAKRLGIKGSLGAAVRILRTLSLECSDSWEKKNPKFLLFVRPMPLPSDWFGFPFSSHPLETIYSSRWCWSGLVPIRGVLKDILIPHSAKLQQTLEHSTCPLCRKGDEFKKFYLSMKTYPFTAINDENLVHHVCLCMDLKDFVTKNDKELCYERIKKIMGEFSKLKAGDSMYLCNPCLLTRLDLGLIYLMAGNFFNTVLVASTEPSPTFGIFFRHCQPRLTSERITGHIHHSMNIGRSELVSESILNNYFATHLLHAMNTSLLRNWLKAIYRDLEGAGII